MVLNCLWVWPWSQTTCKLQRQRNPFLLKVFNYNEDFDRGLNTSYPKRKTKYKKKQYIYIYFFNNWKRLKRLKPGRLTEALKFSVSRSSKAAANRNRVCCEPHQNWSAQLPLNHCVYAAAMFTGYPALPVGILRWEGQQRHTDVHVWWYLYEGTINSVCMCDRYKGKGVVIVFMRGLG